MDLPASPTTTDSTTLKGGIEDVESQQEVTTPNGKLICAAPPHVIADHILRPLSIREVHKLSSERMQSISSNTERQWSTGAGKRSTRHW